MMRIFLEFIARNRPCRVIESNGKPYLYRMYIFHFGGWRVYLHKFVGEDGERWIHDHPFTGVSLILAGSYIEEVVHRMSLPKPITHDKHRRFFNWVPAGKFHRIKRIYGETWTLFVHSPHRKAWGFLDSIDGGLFYHNPFDLNDSCGAHWWDKQKSYAEVMASL